MFADEEEFNTLFARYNDVKKFKINKSFDILMKYSDKAKFVLTIEEKQMNESARKQKKRSKRPNPKHLSSSTVCLYTICQYIDLWVENEIILESHQRKYLAPYYRYIITEVINSFSESGAKKPELESLDEFSLLNIISMLKDIQEIIQERISIKDYSNEVLSITKKVCDEYCKKTIPFQEHRHPYILYKILQIYDSRKDFFKAEKYKNMYNQIYLNGKYELYRQIALYKSDDRSLFDVKRLIYSLLIVTTNNRYTNNLIKDDVLEILFKEQFRTGLWATGEIVKPNFVFEKNTLISIKDRIISGSPILSSVECLNDMLRHNVIREDLEKYIESLSKSYEWVVKRQIKPTEKDSDGWFLEYEGTHIPKSWVAGHTLVFLNEYCKLLSDIIRKKAERDLNAKYQEKFPIKWEDLNNSYNVKNYVGKIIEYINDRSKDEYLSVFLYGPPGTGKSTIAQSLAKKINWKYVELMPGQFLSEGEDMIIPNINKIFERLYRLRDTVVFIDEVDKLVEIRDDKSSSKWIVTTLLPKLKELRSQKDKVFFLATNGIENVDTAVIRPGRFDFILPMGSINWRDRLIMLIKSAKDKKGNIPKRIRDMELFNDRKIITARGIFIEDKKLKDNKWLNKEDITNPNLINYLENTDFIPWLDLMEITDLLNQRAIKSNDLYKTFFLDKGMNEDYIDANLKKFHCGKRKEQKPRGLAIFESELFKMQVPQKYKREISDKKIIKENIFWKYDWEENPINIVNESSE